MKQCTKCLNKYSIDNFYKRKDKYSSQCKSCLRKRRIKYYLNNKTIEKQRFKAYQKNNAEKMKITRKQWVENNPEKYREIIQRYRANNWLKRGARKLHNYHVNKGNVLREACKICNNPKAEAHHSDYTKPLDVLWLCKKHHSAWHRVFSAEKTEIRAIPVL